LTALGRRRSAFERYCVSQALPFTRAGHKNGGARLDVTFHRSSFVMGCSPCGVRGLDIPCSAHIGTRSQTYEDQRSKQVTVVPSMTPYESFDRLYPTSQNRRARTSCWMLSASGTEKIEISDQIADVSCRNIPDENQRFSSGRESEIYSAESEALCCNSSCVATSSLSFTLMNFSEVTERVVPIQTAQSCTVMLTTHICLKTLCWRSKG
jgi:hypothetical protein